MVIPSSIDLFNFARPHDLNFNIAISDKNEKIKFYSSKSYDQVSTASKLFQKHDNIKQNRKYHRKKIEAKTLDYILKNSKYKNR